MQHPVYFFSDYLQKIYRVRDNDFTVHSYDHPRAAVGEREVQLGAIAVLPGAQTVRRLALSSATAKKGVRLTQNIQVGPCILVGVQL